MFNYFKKKLNKDFQYRIYDFGQNLGRRVTVQFTRIYYSQISLENLPNLANPNLIYSKRKRNFRQFSQDIPSSIFSSPSKSF